MINSMVGPILGFLKVAVLVFLLTIGLSFTGQNTAYAQETHIVNCSDCNTESDSDAQEAADGVGANYGDVVILNNITTNVATRWTVGTNTMWKGQTANVSPGGAVGPEVGGTTGGGIFTNFGGSGGTASYQSAWSDPTCWSAFPCTTGSIGE